MECSITANVKTRNPQLSEEKFNNIMSELDREEKIKRLEVQIALLNELIENNGGIYIINKLRDLELELSQL